MLQFEELKQALREKEPELRELSDDLGLEQTREEIEKLEQQAAAPDFGMSGKHQKVLQRTAALKAKVEKYEKLQTLYDDTMTLIEMGDEAGDLSMIDEIKEELKKFTDDLETLRLTTLLTGEYDANNAILTFHAVRRRKLRTGPACCTVCTTAGRNATAIRSPHWITSTAKKPG